jgi:hypothetical protein
VVVVRECLFSFLIGQFLYTVTLLHTHNINISLSLSNRLIIHKLRTHTHTYICYIFAAFFFVFFFYKIEIIAPTNQKCVEHRPTIDRARNNIIYMCVLVREEREKKYDDDDECNVHTTLCSLFISSSLFFFRLSLSLSYIHHCS